jgi:pimeloyl-ACP methyl ester carboxylesterase
MDRPGYGYSDYGKAYPSILDQVAAVRKVLEQYPLVEVWLVGYSYGGPIAAAYAGKHPDSVAALVLLAPVIAPEAEPYFWFNPVLNTRLARWFLPQFIDVANQEKLQHTAALRHITPYWKQIEVPVYHLHCEDDWIAPFTANTGWSEAMLPVGQLELITWDGDSHFLPGRIKGRVDSVFRVLGEPTIK